MLSNGMLIYSDFVISVTPVEDSIDQFHQLIKAQKIPSRERVVFMQKLHSIHTDEDIRSFFNGNKDILDICVCQLIHLHYS